MCLWGCFRENIKCSLFAGLPDEIITQLRGAPLRNSFYITFARNPAHLAAESLQGGAKYVLRRSECLLKPSSPDSERSVCPPRFLMQLPWWSKTSSNARGCSSGLLGRQHDCASTFTRRMSLEFRLFSWSTCCLQSFKQGVPNGWVWFAMLTLVAPMGLACLQPRGAGGGLAVNWNSWEFDEFRTRYVAVSSLDQFEHSSADKWFKFSDLRLRSSWHPRLLLRTAMPCKVCSRTVSVRDDQVRWARMS